MFRRSHARVYGNIHVLRLRHYSVHPVSPAPPEYIVEPLRKRFVEVEKGKGLDDGQRRRQKSRKVGSLARRDCVGREYSLPALFGYGHRQKLALAHHIPLRVVFVIAVERYFYALVGVVERVGHVAYFKPRAHPHALPILCSRRLFVVHERAQKQIRGDRVPVCVHYLLGVAYVVVADFGHVIIQILNLVALNKERNAPSLYRVVYVLAGRHLFVHKLHERIRLRERELYAPYPIVKRRIGSRAPALVLCFHKPLFPRVKFNAQILRKVYVLALSVLVDEQNSLRIGIIPDFQRNGYSRPPAVREYPFR